MHRHAHASAEEEILNFSGAPSSSSGVLSEPDQTQLPNLLGTPVSATPLRRPSQPGTNTASGSTSESGEDEMAKKLGPSLPLRVVLVIIAGALVFIGGIWPLTYSEKINDLILDQVKTTMYDTTIISREVVYVLFGDLGRTCEFYTKNVPVAFHRHVNLTTVLDHGAGRNFKGVQNKYTDVFATWDMPYLTYAAFFEKLGFPFYYGAMNGQSLSIRYGGQLRIITDPKIHRSYVYHFTDMSSSLKYFIESYPARINYLSSFSDPVEFYKGYEDVYTNGTAHRFTFTSPIGTLYGMSLPSQVQMPDLTMGPRFGAFALMDYQMVGDTVAALLQPVQANGYSFVLMEPGANNTVVACTKPGTVVTEQVGHLTVLEKQNPGYVIPNHCFNQVGVVYCRRTLDEVWPLFGKIYRQEFAEAAGINENPSLFTSFDSAEEAFLHGQQDVRQETLEVDVFDVDGDKFIVSHMNMMEFGIQFGFYGVAEKEEQLSEFRKRQYMAIGVTVAVAIIGTLVIMFVTFSSTTSINFIIDSMTHIAQLGILRSDGKQKNIIIAEFGDIDDAVHELNDELGKLKRFVPGYVRSALFSKSSQQQTYEHPAAKRVSEQSSTSTNPLANPSANNFFGSSSTSFGRTRTTSLAAAGAPGSEAGIKVCVLNVHLGNCHLYDNQTKREYVELLTKVADILTEHHADVESMTSGQVIAAFRANKLIMPTAHACRCAIAITEEIEKNLQEGNVVGSDAVVCIDFGRCEVHPFASSSFLAKILNGNPLKVVQMMPPLARFLGVRIMVTADVASTCSYVTMVADSVKVHLGGTNNTVRLYELLSVKPEEASPDLLEEVQQVRFAFSSMLQGNYEEALSSMRKGINSLRIKRLKRLCTTIMSDETLKTKGYCRDAQERSGWNNLWATPHTDSDLESQVGGEVSSFA